MRVFFEQGGARGLEDGGCQVGAGVVGCEGGGEGEVAFADEEDCVGGGEGDDGREVGFWRGSFGFGGLGGGVVYLLLFGLVVLLFRRFLGLDEPAASFCHDDG